MRGKLSIWGRVLSFSQSWEQVKVRMLVVVQPENFPCPSICPSDEFLWWIDPSLVEPVVEREGTRNGKEKSWRASSVSLEHLGDDD